MCVGWDVGALERAGLVMHADRPTYLEDPLGVVALDGQYALVAEELRALLLEEDAEPALELPEVHLALEPEAHAGDGLVVLFDAGGRRMGRRI